MVSIAKQQDTASFYNTHATKLAAQYQSTSFELVHESWIAHLSDVFVSHSSSHASSHGSSNTSYHTSSPSASTDPKAYSASINVLDIGAGSGRDVKYLAEQATSQQSVAVYAIEPASELAAIGKSLTQDLNVTWIQDSLPALNTLSEISDLNQANLHFKLILLSAVWMHIPESQRLQALTRLAQLLEPQGKLIITLRHGPSGDEREMHQVSIQELETLCLDLSDDGLKLTIIDSVKAEKDKLGRDNKVYWETLVLQKVNKLGNAIEMQSTGEQS
ncbi:bifunctional 2-polyprenyl-6-hydroxyphenol methylase/3-demethylubiquinol 3-O-methyltransferase UbiG [uncultured Shewanella sp.]|uniref:class I SAM-dependent methyltransferase n=1 Tax=uncultured Shewanella sp. TaxID=173975 RepID=UPI0026114F11|nr:class I SAM-dependent methyltransferase [uncultured Shewanella sp.]